MFYYYDNYTVHNYYKVHYIVFYDMLQYIIAAAPLTWRSWRDETA